MQVSTITRAQYDNIKGDWLKLVFSFDDYPTRTFAWFEHILSCYSAIGRYWHDIRYAYTIVVNVHRGCQAVEPRLDSRVIEFAAWLHRVAWDPSEDNNEMESAVLAEKCLHDLDFPHSFIDMVRSMIMLTADTTVIPDNTHGEILLDAINFTLAQSDTGYEKYLTLLRAENAFMSDITWHNMRLEFVDKMLERENIFFTPAFQKKENEARANLSNEKANILIFQHHLAKKNT